MGQFHPRHFCGEEAPPGARNLVFGFQCSEFGMSSVRLSSQNRKEIEFVIAHSNLLFDRTARPQEHEHDDSDYIPGFIM